MIRSSLIIAAISATLLLGGARADAAAPSAFAAYRVQLEISRNGVSLGSPESTVASGESSSQVLPGVGRRGGVLMRQRVTGFPGAADYKALLELELHGLSGADSQPIVAPTFGIELGRSQRYELPTDEGLILILARVDGVDAMPETGPPEIQTMPYPQT